MHKRLKSHNRRPCRLDRAHDRPVIRWCVVWLLAWFCSAHLAVAQDRSAELPVENSSVVETAAELPTADLFTAEPEPFRSKSVPVVRTPGVSAGDWLSAVLGLVLIVVLILLAAWFVKRFTGLAVGQNKQLNVVAALPLGPRERIALIQVGNQQVLVGITAQTITHLQSYDTPVIEPVDGRSSEFSKRLQSVLSGDQGMKNATKGNKEHA